MQRLETLKDLFRRYRRPGDLVFAALFLAASLVLLASLGGQVTWVAGAELASQPAFWPTIAVGGMVLFSALHFVGSLASPRIEGRWAEVGFWVRSLEYALWYMGYVLLVPRLGYLPAFRAGYRRGGLVAAVVGGAAIVVTFKALLGVHVPGGAVYEHLPAGLRSFMLTYL